MKKNEEMKRQGKALLEKLTQAHGAPGSEQAVAKIIKNELNMTLERDRLGSVIGVLDGTCATPKIMIAAHLDEVGFMVQSVTDDGFIRFVPLGGWWDQTLLAQRVRILTRSHGEILGVISATSPHLLKEDERKKLWSIEEMLIDVGANSGVELKTDFGIMPGDPIVPESSFTVMHKPDWVLSKAFDNRVGVALAIQALQYFQDRPHPNTLCFAGTVQEEVGVRGATTAGYSIAPDVAIILEGPPADDYNGQNRAGQQGGLGKGPQIRVMDPSAIMNRSLVEFALELATQLKIPHQLAVRRSGGTDAKAVQLTRSGVPSIVIGVPARYIHTHNSILNLEDYCHTLRLLIAMIGKLDNLHTQHFYPSWS